jgi:hypothetical protein
VVRVTLHGVKWHEETGRSDQMVRVDARRLFAVVDKTTMMNRLSEDPIMVQDMTRFYVMMKHRVDLTGNFSYDDVPSGASLEDVFVWNG